MRKKVHQKAVRNRRRKQKGSALLVSLMVMVGLSLLGLTFVAISETENAISVNERNKKQTSALAESAARLGVQWFQQPATLRARGLLPANDTDFKTLRVVEGYEGYYKPTGTLFDTPYGPEQDDLLYGSEDSADIVIERRNDDSNTFLDNLNAALYTNDEAGEITSIRVYAPPMVGATLLSGFWVGGQRYGVATIAATAEKTNAKGVVIARSVCRIVIAPFPLPGPTGAVQAIGTFEPNGAYETYWGSIESEDTGETYIKREDTQLPRFDPYDIPYIEYGYDSSREWAPATEFYPGDFDDGPLGENVRPTDPDLAEQYEFTCVDVRIDNLTAAAGSEPDWEAHLDGAPFWDNNVQWRLRPAVTAYPISTGPGTPRPGYDNHAWLPELISRSVTDPWFSVRTRGWIEGKKSGDHKLKGALVMDYAALAGANMNTRADDFLDVNNAPSAYFQYQTTNNKYLYKQVDIPTFDYDFWKAAAIAASDEPNVWYLRHEGDADFTDGVTSQSAENWIKNNEGFLFFDAQNNYNPQKLTGAAKTAQLVDHSLDPCGAKGLVYMNFTEVSSGGGCKPPAGYYRQPGELYRDIGYRRVNEETVGSQTIREFTTDALGTSIVIEKAYDGKWDYQDLPFSNGDTAKNGYFDVCVAERSFRQESDPDDDAITEWVPLPYYPGCTVGNNRETAGCNCSEPHEPYLNIRYSGSPTGIAAGWSDPNDDVSTYAKETDDETPSGDLVDCTADDVASAAGQEKCATNAWDKIGAMAQLSGNSAPGVVGVLYNEGNYASNGNASYYGSIVVAGHADPNGTQEVWFDACLVSGCWPPPDIAFPRVMVTSIQIQ